MPAKTDKPKAKTKQQWKRIVHQRHESNLSTQAFCREQGITSRQFYYWRRKLKKQDTPLMIPTKKKENPEPEYTADISSIFLPVKVPVEDTSDPQSMCFTVKLKSGHKILVPSDIDLNALINLVAALETEKC